MVEMQFSRLIRKRYPPTQDISTRHNSLHQDIIAASDLSVFRSKIFLENQNMASLVAAGLLMCKWEHDKLLYFLVHPGGPFFARKDKGVWTIPKGLPENEEELLATATREFNEETGIVPTGPYYPLGSITQKRGKIVHAWAFIGDWDPASGITCNSFTIEWPPKSGKMKEFPEQDRGEWMDLEKATASMITEQIPFLERAKKIFESEGK
jgi:predicted NUDIX family NTP pyrophosphohydrolase